MHVEGNYRDPSCSVTMLMVTMAYHTQNYVCRGNPVKVDLTATVSYQYQGNDTGGIIHNLLFEPEKASDGVRIHTPETTPHDTRRQQEAFPHSMSISRSGASPNGTRRRRYDYEDKHEWPEGDSIEYNLDEEGEGEELTFWQEAGRNWQVVALRATFIFCALSVVVGIWCTCCYVWCRVCCHSLTRVLTPWRPCLEICMKCYEDPMYNRARDLAELMGIKLDYKTYMTIKETHEFGGKAGFNPLGMRNKGFM